MRKKEGVKFGFHQELYLEVGRRRKSKKWVGFSLDLSLEMEGGEREKRTGFGFYQAQSDWEGKRREFGFNLREDEKEE